MFEDFVFTLLIFLLRFTASADSTPLTARLVIDAHPVNRKRLRGCSPKKPKKRRKVPNGESELNSFNFL